MLEFRFLTDLVSDELIDKLEKQLKDQQQGSETTGLSDELHSLRDELKKVHENVERLTAPIPEPESQNNPELDHALALVCSLCGIEIHEIEYTDTEVIYRCSQSGKYGGKFGVL